MGPGGLRSDSESEDRPSESFRFAIEEKRLQVRILLARGQEVFTTSTGGSAAESEPEGEERTTRVVPFSASFMGLPGSNGKAP